MYRRDCEISLISPFSSQVNIDGCICDRSIELPCRICPVPLHQREIHVFSSQRTVLSRSTLMMQQSYIPIFNNMIGNNQWSSPRKGWQRMKPAQIHSAREKPNPQVNYWRKYTTTTIQQSSSPFTCVSSDNNKLNLLAIAHGQKVSLLEGDKVVREVAFRDPISAVCLRDDGRVLACGDEAGRIEVVDCKDRFKLRSFHNHSKRVSSLHLVGNALYSAGEDMVMRLYDVAAGNVVHSYANAHDDYVRCVRQLQTQHVLSAAYDGFIKLFDFRVHEKAQMVFNHREQVEWVDPYPSKLLFAACGGTSMSVWDVRSEKPLQQIANHKKVVSCVRVIGSRILTSSYDQLFKVYEADTFKITYREKVHAQIFSFDISADGKTLLFAVEGNKAIVKHRGVKEAEGEESGEEEIFQLLRKNETEKFTYNDKHFYRGVYERANQWDVIVPEEKQTKLTSFDRLLKQFKYKEALIMSAEQGAGIYVAVVDQLLQRGSLDRTLRSLTEEEVVHLVATLTPTLHKVGVCEWTLLVFDALTKIDAEAVASAVEDIRLLADTCVQLQVMDGKLELVQSLFK